MLRAGERTRAGSCTAHLGAGWLLRMSATELKGAVRPRQPWETRTLGELRDRARFDEFVRDAYPRMVWVAAQLLRCEDDAFDVAQRVFIELYEVVTGRLAEPGAIAAAFLYDRVRWRAHDAFRDQRRRPQTSAPLPDGEGGAGADSFRDADGHPDRKSADVEAFIIAVEKRGALDRAGLALAGRRREVFALLMKGETPAEAARQLGISRPRVSQLMRLLCTDLRSALREQGWQCDETCGIPLNSSPGWTPDL